MVALQSPEFAAVTVQELRSTCDTCPILQQVKIATSFNIAKGWPRSAKSLNSAIAPYHRIRNELAVQDGYVICGICHSSRDGAHKAETEGIVLVAWHEIMFHLSPAW